MNVAGMQLSQGCTHITYITHIAQQTNYNKQQHPNAHH